MRAAVLRRAELVGRVVVAARRLPRGQRRQLERRGRCRPVERAARRTDASDRPAAPSQVERRLRLHGARRSHRHGQNRNDSLASIRSQPHHARTKFNLPFDATDQSTCIPRIASQTASSTGMPSRRFSARVLNTCSPGIARGAAVGGRHGGVQVVDDGGDDARDGVGAGGPADVEREEHLRQAELVGLPADLVRRLPARRAPRRARRRPTTALRPSSSRWATGASSSRIAPGVGGQTARLVVAAWHRQLLAAQLQRLHLAVGELRHRDVQHHGLRRRAGWR